MSGQFSLRPIRPTFRPRNVCRIASCVSWSDAASSIIPSSRICTTFGNNRSSGSRHDSATPPICAAAATSPVRSGIDTSSGGSTSTRSAIRSQSLPNNRASDRRCFSSTPTAIASSNGSAIESSSSNCCCNSAQRSSKATDDPTSSEYVDEWGQAGLDRVREEDLLGEGVQSADRGGVQVVQRRVGELAGRALASLLELDPQPVPQLGTGLLGEGDGGDRAQRYAVAQDECRHAIDEGVRLAGSGAGFDEERGVGVRPDPVAGAARVQQSAQSSPATSRRSRRIDQPDQSPSAGSCRLRSHRARTSLCPSPSGLQYGHCTHRKSGTSGAFGGKHPGRDRRHDHVERVDVPLLDLGGQRHRDPLPAAPDEPVRRLDRCRLFSEPRPAPRTRTPATAASSRPPRDRTRSPRTARTHRSSRPSRRWSRPRRDRPCRPSPRSSTRPDGTGISTGGSPSNPNAARSPPPTRPDPPASDRRRSAAPSGHQGSATAPAATTADARSAPRPRTDPRAPPRSRATATAAPPSTARRARGANPSAATRRRRGCSGSDSPPATARSPADPRAPRAAPPAAAARRSTHADTSHTPPVTSATRSGPPPRTPADPAPRTGPRRSA